MKTTTKLEWMSECVSHVLFFKPEDIEERWVYIHGQGTEEEKLSEIFNYFVEQWLDKMIIATRFMEL